MVWFGRDHTERQLREQERAFLEALVDLLSEVQPAQIDEGETALAAEGEDCLIVLMPHRALGGIAIVVWLEPSEAAVTLAQVGGLGINHDSLDLGVWVARVELDPSRPDFTELLRRIREQLLAPLTVRLYGSDQATVWAHNNMNVLRRVGNLGRRVGWFERRFRGAPTSEIQIRFVDSESPPISEPSDVNKWFRRRGLIG